MNIWNFWDSGQILLWGLSAVAGYNLYLWQQDKKLADRFQKRILAVPDLSRTPKVTALVAGWNECDYIDAHIRSFLELNYPNIELVLCVGGTDDTLPRAQRYAGDSVIVLEQCPGEGKQRALARAFERASGDIIYLIDADCVYVDAALKKLLSPLVEEGEQVATGSIRYLDEQSDKILPTYLSAVEAMWNARQPKYIKGLQGANTAITRRALEQINGLDFPARTGTDYLLAQRLIRGGIAIRQVSTSIVPTDYPETIRAYMHQRSRWLRNLLIHGWHNKSKGDVWVTVKTMIIGVFMLMMPLTIFIFGKNALMVWFLLVVHAILSRIRYILFMTRFYHRKTSARMIASLVPLTLIDFVAWAMPMLDLTTSRRREKW